MIFDLDGTLVDSNYLHTVAWWRALQHAGFAHPMNAIHRLIGMGSDQLLPRLIGRQDAEIASARDDEYAKMIGDVLAFPGAEELLGAVREVGLQVVLATSSSPDDFAQMIELVGGTDALDAHTTIDDVTRSKPDGEIFLKAMEIGRLDASRSIAVGDSRWDIEAADAAGLACIGVETGGTSRDELLRAGAVHVYRDVHQLREHLTVSPIGALTRSTAGPRT